MGDEPTRFHVVPDEAGAPAMASGERQCASSVQTDSLTQCFFQYNTEIITVAIVLADLARISPQNRVSCPYLACNCQLFWIESVE